VKVTPGHPKEIVTMFQKMLYLVGSEGQQLWPPKWELPLCNS